MESSLVSEATKLENMTVAEALEQFYQEHRFGKAAYTEPWNTVFILGIKLPTGKWPLAFPLGIGLPGSMCQSRSPWVGSFLQAKCVRLFLRGAGATIFTSFELNEIR